MSTKRYYTVVYEITDEAAFKRVALAAEGSKETNTGLIDGVQVIACGEGDYATERDAYGQQMELQGLDKARVLADYLADEEENAHDR